VAGEVTIMPNKKQLFTDYGYAVMNPGHGGVTSTDFENTLAIYRTKKEAEKFRKSQCPAFVVRQVRIVDISTIDEVEFWQKEWRDAHSQLHEARCILRTIADEQYNAMALLERLEGVVRSEE
jgi:hypothetical protein